MADGPQGPPVSINPPAADSTPTRPPVPCRFCGVPVEQPKRRDITKEYCSDRHRAAFRDAQVQAAVRNALQACQDAADAMAEHQARLEGAMQQLARFARKSRKSPPEKK